MGLLIYLEVVERAGMVHGGSGARKLAIASCGNAALAAAVVARAGGRPLEVFIPTWADPKVVARLEALGARLAVCPRQEGVPGDPAYLRLQQALAAGALPFTCQGPDNGLTIEGGMTLGYEIVSALARSGGRLDRLFLQVGGGALASACVQSLEDAARLGALASFPRIHAVQTRGGYPLKRAYDRVVQRIVEGLGATAESYRAGDSPLPEGHRLTEGHRLAEDHRLAALIRERAVSPEVAATLRYAATHRAEFMWPWEEEPRSVAHGILDDETYDWLAIVAGMVRTRGYPVVVDEDTLEEANALAREATGVDVDHTGSAGLAGLVALLREGIVAPEENVAVLFTGVRR
jgi:threonine synthase